ncbi:hypothetical protein IWQ60_003922 [Tieghemiomyces parasiticus]|uniref:RED-like N-terminal domain-containing protein n=1 Tax=Tieghemiomyces parasiticus TaxID=78921 RepID=A0A9W8ABZ7_9FUNG|nr:hypothetical protein IWQ60_003922 [Tieghemiomyces parasiticus]
MSDRQGGLNQEDFRKLLATPRPQADPSQQPGSFAHARRTAPGAAGQSSKPSKSKGKRPASKPDTTAEPQPKYRDRAAERRRQGYQSVPGNSETASAINAQPFDFNTAGADGAEQRDISYEQSKYLGGDLERTHLVKGLDYLFLEKIRREDAAAASGEAPDGDIDEALERLHHEKAATSTATVTDRAAELAALPLPHFLTPRGSAIYNASVLWPVRYRSELPRENPQFQPGRMYFTFELADSQGNYRDPLAVPTPVLRSKVELVRMEARKQMNESGSAAGGTEADGAASLVMEKVMQVFARHARHPARVTPKASPGLPISSTTFTSTHLTSHLPEDLIKIAEKATEVTTHSGLDPSDSSSDSEIGGSDDDIFAGVGDNYNVLESESV